MAEIAKATEQSKTRMCIVFGGRSGEHEVSLLSAASVIAALNTAEYDISVAGITKTGRLATRRELFAMLPEALWSRIQPALVAADSSHDALAPAAPGALRAPAWPILATAPQSLPEIVFPLLHGPYGEDGTIQGLFDIADIPYIGCGVLASAVAMDKDIVKRVWAQLGLPVTPWITARALEIADDLPAIQRRAEKALGYPMFAKPANLGSSVGVRKIHDAQEFAAAVTNAAAYDRKVLIEKAIAAREIECAILGNTGAAGDDAPQASIAGEVLSAGEFYDYESKYVNAASRTEIPARIDVATLAEIRRLALAAFAAIDGEGLARVDFFLDKYSGQIWLNEINTMPGFTPISMYARLWEASGVAFPELMRRLIALGRARFAEKRRRD